ncbi:MAG: transcriptional regulator, family [Phenylobacterium sp.]|nr:transcriptional regulator, family [Phenylobacterium sp.]
MSNGVDVIVGRRLKARRRLLGFSQQRVAVACGVTFQQIQKYECAACRLSAHMLWKLSCALDVEISYFFEGMSRDALDDDVRSSRIGAELSAASPGA